MSGPALPTFQFQDGRQFVSHQVLPPPADYPDSPFWKESGDSWVRWDEADFGAWLTDLWQDAYDFKRPETARLQRNAFYRDGFHYEHAWINQSSAIENHIWRVIETQVANTVAARPRPEVMPTSGMSGEVADRLQKYAVFIEESSDFDSAVYLGARDKRTFGWNVWLLTFDYRTGMPRAVPYSVFDFYWDPAGRNEDECQHFIFAGPQPTELLRATYPDMAERILSDDKASPAYDANVRPWSEFLDHVTSGYSPPLIAEGAMAVHNEGDTPTEGTTLVADTGGTKRNGKTTFLFQVLLRDHGTMPCPYLGTMNYPPGHPEHPDGGDVPGMKYTDKTDRCPSGFWLVTMTAAGVLLAVEQLDTCYLGENFVIDRVSQVTDRFVSLSDVDQCIPIQRGLNRRGRVLDQALELSGNPPVLDFQSGIARQLNGGNVNAGDVLEIARGSDVRFLTFDGPPQQHFEREAQAKQAMREVAGTHSAMEGESPGANAPAAAIQQLDTNAQRRLQGGESPAHRARSKLVRKLMYMAGKKLQPEILFRATDGDDSAIKGDELTMGYNIAYAEGSGSVEGRQQLEDKSLALYDRQIIDEQSVLDIMRWPNRNEVAARMVQRKMQEAAMAAAAKASAAPAQGNNSQSQGAAA